MQVLILAFNPEIPQIEIIEEDLSDIPFPVSFRICVDEESDKIKSYGYNDSFGFFLGTSKFNKSIVGWNGHYSNGSTIGSVKGLDQLI